MNGGEEMANNCTPCLRKNCANCFWWCTSQDYCFYFHLHNLWR